MGPPPRGSGQAPSPHRAPARPRAVPPRARPTLPAACSRHAGPRRGRDGPDPRPRRRQDGRLAPPAGRGLGGPRARGAPGRKGGWRSSSRSPRLPSCRAARSTRSCELSSGGTGTRAPGTPLPGAPRPDRRTGRSWGALPGASGRGACRGFWESPALSPGSRGGCREACGARCLLRGAREGGATEPRGGHVGARGGPRSGVAVAAAGRRPTGPSAASFRAPSQPRSRPGHRSPSAQRGAAPSVASAPGPSELAGEAARAPPAARGCSPGRGPSAAGPPGGAGALGFRFKPRRARL